MKPVKNKKAFFTTKWITYTAILTALVIATCAIPPITIPPLVGGIYWCDCVIFLASYLLDPIASFIVGGIGTLLYDLWLGKAETMLVSLLIHGLQASAISFLIHYVFVGMKKYETLWAGISSAVGAIIVILGYFVFYWAVAPLVLAGGSKYGLEYATVRIPRNIIQEIIGVIIAMVICYATTFKKQLKNSHLLPDFKNEVLEKKNKPDTQEEPTPQEPTE